MAKKFEDCHYDKPSGSQFVAIGPTSAACLKGFFIYVAWGLDITDRIKIQMLLLYM